MTPGGAATSQELRRAVLPALALALAVLAVYAQTATFGFSDYDDTIYVSENPVIAAGITWAGVKEVVLHGHHLLWTPITSFSYMLGCTLHGTNAAGHHLTSVLLHIVAAWLVFWTLWRYTGAWGFAWFVAAVFALHPLNVESVAWVSGRKNQLYAIFWMLSLLAYRRYTLSHQISLYILILLLHLAGLASKPTHLVLPVVLLLLDIWPLRRIEPRALFTLPGIRQALWLGVEKLPLLALSIAVSLFTFNMVAEGGGLRDLAEVPLAQRIPNTAYVYAFYLLKLFWPTGLTIHYPFPIGGFPSATIVLSYAVLGLITLVSLLPLVPKFHLGTHLSPKLCFLPLFVGWWWYLLVLLPESGLLRANSFLMADRYAYVSTLGLIIAVAWTARPLVARLPVRAAWGGGALLLALLGGYTAWQATFWKDDLALWTRSAALYPDSPVAHDSLGVALKKAGRTDDAVLAFKRALACPGPFKVLPSMNLGTIYFEREDYKEAASYFEEVAERNPTFVPALVWAGRTLERQGKPEAASILDRAGVLAPDNPEVRAALAGRTPDPIRGWTDLGRAWLGLGRDSEALAAFARVLTLDPDAPLALKGTWSAQMMLGDPAAAEATMRRYLQKHPDEATPWAALAVSLEQLHRSGEARDAVKRALALDPAYPQALEVQRRLDATMQLPVQTK
jgi:Flp pilus assembly protein TadD